MGATYLLRAEPPATGPAVTTALRRVTALADTTAVGALPHAEDRATGCAMAGQGIRRHRMQTVERAGTWNGKRDCG